MLIRTEAPADILAIDRLLKSAFETDAEANLVMTLRENSHLTLSLVACDDDGEVVGHVMFSPVLLNGEDLNWQGLAPLAVKKEWRNQGVAASLVKEGLICLAEFDYPACVVLGDPDYYQRFGFKEAAKFDFRCRWDVPVGAFQIVALVDGELSGRAGLIEYCPEFNEL
ncbi:MULTISPECIES: GNAT family N-acetyltransferase [Vibrio]|uniref:GNAT family N-acetyltransferase n=1 Tax=Vibrio TaxID=662 RepID=UPI000B7BEE0A|nr:MULTISPECIES: N-acetyltransferase [Vibrio]ASO28495.1 GNAT family N-acetyltransferase [Vibrio anguillarum]MDQ2190570.1 N-acetyltransferase [Vibrio sp. A14(2019)]MDQ2195951.1 N-acetyltransferase [Vibrio sp. 2017_1457_11]NAX19566.1 GNAT family N-acetyltransferase [Vibrio sp. V22_P2S10T140]NNN75183.1 N-acetyltransferase [Vibrio sp. B7]